MPQKVLVAQFKLRQHLSCICSGRSTLMTVSGIWFTPDQKKKKGPSIKATKKVPHLWHHCASIEWELKQDKRGLNIHNVCGKCCSRLLILQRFQMFRVQFDTAESEKLFHVCIIMAFTGINVSHFFTKSRKSPFLPFLFQCYMLDSKCLNEKYVEQP